MGRSGYSIPKSEKDFETYLPSGEEVRKEKVNLPSISELDLLRHFIKLSQNNLGVDTAFYPLGSCTMKYNPKVNDHCAHLPTFCLTHPKAPVECVQGNLALMHMLIEKLTTLTGMAGGTLLPSAGAQGEFVGVKMIVHYHRARNESYRNEMLIPDNAHGTNPATAAMCGLTTRTIRSNSQGDLDIEHLKELISDRCAGLMLTNPNTLGLFSPNILEVSRLIHQAGGLLYYDGANFNPLLNVVKPRKMGFDVIHLNLHKTFSTPHGGGGPGSGPVLCSSALLPFLPTPLVKKKGEQFFLEESAPQSIGKIVSFYGNFSVYLRALAYYIFNGESGLRKVAESALLNANYLKKRLETSYKIPFKGYCSHEFVIQADTFLDQGIKALDIAKRLLDFGVYAPTVYFPLIVKEALLIEPTECESKETLDRFVEIMEQIVKEIKDDPEKVKQAPHTLSHTRLNEVKAARDIISGFSRQ